MNLDYALRVDAPAALIAESSTEQKKAYEKWERSNHISLVIMKGSITTAIRRAIPDLDNAKLYLAHIEEQFQGSSKAHATTLITKMVTLKYSGSNGVREHILQMNDMDSQLKGLDMEISEDSNDLDYEVKMNEINLTNMTSICEGGINRLTISIYVDGSMMKVGVMAVMFYSSGYYYLTIFTSLGFYLHNNHYH
ncbi:hypothetical protein RJ639_044311 [Escallonia herrerae]|uniref:UBN2_2 domain-containing protein n=1 Tax=Escallonia herrerae TaxID=1293975 RepID=A0AA89B0R0_9ASTE|nr:hypothetical protein RJ639_044311 [Escallonia herrerae]